MKVCTVCKTEKPLFDFSPDKRIKSGLQSRCKPCYAKIMKERRAANPESHRLSVKKSTQKNYQKKLDRNNKYRRANPDKVSEWKRKDRLVNKPRVLADNARRRGWTCGETSPEVEQLYALRDFYRAMSLGEEFHVDHIKPLSKGGLHIFSNMQVIPAVDNLRKGVQ
jgi:hypothetical protein